MTGWGRLLEQLKKESLILLGFLDYEDVTQAMLGVTNRTFLRMRTTQRRTERWGEIAFR